MTLFERGKLYTTKDLSEMTGIGTRTLSNRLLFLRVSNPDSYVITRLSNKRPIFHYKGECLSEEMLKDKNYDIRKAFSKEMKQEAREVNLPPIFKWDKHGNKYNLFSLKAFLRILLDKKLYLTAKYSLHMLFWVFVIIYTWSI